MKRIYIALFLSLVTVLPSMAQYRNRTVSHSTSGSRSNYQRSESRYHSRWTDYERETYYGLRLGVAVASVHSDDQYLDGGDGMAGLNIGVVAGTQLAPSAPVFLEGGLYYTQKGGKGYNSGKKFTYDLNYLEVPIVVKYKYFFENDLSIQPFLGGFLACGIGGKIKDFGDRVFQSSFSDENFQRFDGGIRLGCGFSFQNIYLDLSYDFGLANICHDTFDTSHTGCFYATVGVDF